MGSGVPLKVHSHSGADDDEDNPFIPSVQMHEIIGNRLGRASAVRHDLILLQLNSTRLETRTEVISSLNGKLIKAVEKKLKATHPTAITKRTQRRQQKEIDDLHLAVKLLQEAKTALVPMQQQLSSVILTYEDELTEIKRELAGSQSRRLVSLVTGASSAFSKKRPAKATGEELRSSSSQRPSQQQRQEAFQLVDPQNEPESTKALKIKVHVHHDEPIPSKDLNTLHVIGETILVDEEQLENTMLAHSAGRNDGRNTNNNLDRTGGTSDSDGGDVGGCVRSSNGRGGGLDNLHQWGDRLSNKLAGDLLSHSDQSAQPAAANELPCDAEGPLPYGGDVQAATKASDRPAIRRIMRYNQGKKKSAAAEESVP